MPPHAANTADWPPVAKHEREAISERTKAALQATKRRGVKLGGPRLDEARRRSIAARSEAAFRERTRTAGRFRHAARFALRLARQGNSEEGREETYLLGFISSS
jgi:DNA invertase Pin-like site-specific DNA recombinase